STDCRRVGIGSATSGRRSAGKSSPANGNWWGRRATCPTPATTPRPRAPASRFFVIRDRDGQLRGFHNVCPHRASQLLDDGHGHCGVLRCRYHGWVFDTAGNLKRAPDFGEADWFKKEDNGLMPIRVETWRGLVFANFDAGAPSLAV